MNELTAPSLLQLESTTDEENKPLREFCAFLRKFISDNKIVDSQNDYQKDDEDDNCWANSEELFINLILDEMLNLKSLYNTLDFQVTKTDLLKEHKCLAGNLGKVLHQIKTLNPAIEKMLPYNPKIDNAIEVLDCYYQDLIQVKNQIESMSKLEKVESSRKSFCINIAKVVHELFERFGLSTSSTVTGFEGLSVGSGFLEFLQQCGWVFGLNLSVSTWHGYLSDAKKM